MSEKIKVSVMSALMLAGNIACVVGASWDGNRRTQIVSLSDENQTLKAAPAESPKAAPRGRVLVVLSSEDKITLKDGVVHPTGFFLSELMVPLKKLLGAGYEPVFSNPRGNNPIMDKISDNAYWFGDAPDAAPAARERARLEYREIRELCRRLGVCGEGVLGTMEPKRLAQVLADGLDSYQAVFVPGGHAPMEDLWRSRELGAILRHFHSARKPTALICHGPIALLSALEDPEGYAAALTSGDALAQREKAKDWIYKDYALTVFSTPEEQQQEPGQDNALGGFMKFYPEQALQGAGARVSNAPKWHGNVVVDRELVTGQNPMSDQALGEALLKALAARSQP